MFSAAQIIVLAMPVFLALMVLEFIVGWRRGRNTYALADTLNSIGLGLLSQLAGLFTRLFAIGLYSAVSEHWAPWRLPLDAPWVWLAGLLAYDCCYYWLHRAGHRVAVLWAAHAVHHQSEEYNLSTALRQTGSGWLLGWVFYLPLALLGLPPLVFGTVALIDLLYQFWVHTRQIGRLGRFDRWFCSPSNHRVHHAVNDRYLDRNYGGILMLWDHLFGTFTPEDEREPIVYGTRTPLASWDPLWANAEVYVKRWHDARHARGWREAWRVWLAPPDWRPPAALRADPGPPFDLQRARYAPPLTARRAWAASLLLVAMLGASAVLLWQSGQWPPAGLAGGAGAIVLGLWGVGRLCGAAPARRG